MIKASEIVDRFSFQHCPIKFHLMVYANRERAWLRISMETKDVDTGERVAIGFEVPRYAAEIESEEAVKQWVIGAVLTAWEHEMKEILRFDSRKILDPHKGETDGNADRARHADKPPGGQGAVEGSG